MMEFKKELSATDVVGGITAASTVGAILFQLGLVGPVGASALSLLTIQDVLLGASACLPFVILFGVLSTLTASLIKDSSGRQLAGYAALFCLLAGSLLTYDFLTSDVGPAIAVTILAIFSAIVGFILNSSMRMAHKIGSSAVLALMLPVLIGSYYSYMATDSSREHNAVVKTDKRSFSGRVLTLSSNYVFIVAEGNLVITPLKDVIEFNRILGVR